VDGFLRAALVLLALLAMSGCSSHGQVAAPPGAIATPKAQGGIFRAVFGSRASRARLQWTNVSQLDGAACRRSLRAWGVDFVSLPDRASPDAKLCGIPHGVRLHRGPTGITWQPALVLDCSMALLLPEVEQVIQAVATAALGQRITRVRTFGTYSCRDMVGWLGTKSEHSFANAIDIAAFDTADGRSITVLRDFYRDTPEGKFLRRLHDQWRSDTRLSYVLGPDHDAAHKNHFHIDHGVRWTAF
jgi:hypothetical protein